MSTSKQTAIERLLHNLDTTEVRIGLEHLGLGTEINSIRYALEVAMTSDDTSSPIDPDTLLVLQRGEEGARLVNHRKEVKQMGAEDQQAEEYLSNPEVSKYMTQVLLSQGTKVDDFPFVSKKIPKSYFEENGLTYITLGTDVYAFRSDIALSHPDLPDFCRQPGILSRFLNSQLFVSFPDAATWLNECLERQDRELKLQTGHGVTAGESFREYFATKWSGFRDQWETVSKRMPQIIQKASR